MDFEKIVLDKIYESILRVKNYGGFLRIRQLLPNKNIFNRNDAEIIGSVIKSKFHHWEGEKNPNGLEINMSAKDVNSQIEWHVYYFFYAFLIIDRQQSIITLIEFGLD